MRSAGGSVNLQTPSQIHLSQLYYSTAMPIKMLRSFTRQAWKHGMDRRQSGFTLIELMVALSIMAVLITLAITSYRHFPQRASVSTGLILSSAIKLSVSEYFIKNNSFPENNAETGLFPPERYTNAHVRSISIMTTPMPGTIAIAYKGAGTISEGDTLLLVPTGTANGIRWRCTSFTLLGNLLPANCR